MLLVDDWIETGNQAQAAKWLIESCGASFVGVAAVVSELEPDPVELRRVHALVRRDELPA